MYKNIDKNLYTPMMRQYLTIKEDYPDSLVFFRLGDFYEMFFNDALVASKELEIVLTKRDAGTNNEPVPMCGVPYHAVNNYIEKLSEKGYKIAIVDQMEDANNKKIVRREVTRIITPGTNIDEHYLEDKNNNYLASIDKDDDHYYFAYTDLSTGDNFVTILSKYPDNLYNEINKLQIKEVVASNRIPKIVKEYLYNFLNILVSNNPVEQLDDYLEKLYTNLNPELTTVCNQLLGYLVKTQKRALIHLKNFSFYDTNEFLKLDFNTVRNLELINTIKKSNRIFDYSHSILIVFFSYFKIALRMRTYWA